MSEERELREVNKGAVVRHRDLGVGQVVDMGPGRAVVEFRRASKQSVAEDELIVLGAGGFWHGMYRDPESAAKALKVQPAEVILGLLSDFPRGTARTDEIRWDLEEFVGDWSAWWQSTQRLLKKEPRIDTSRSREKIYALAEKPRSYIQELYDGFRHAPATMLQAGSGAARELNVRKLQIAREIMVSLADGEELEPTPARDVRDFVKGAVVSQAVAIAERTYLLLRAADAGWFTDEEMATTLGALCREGIRLYELSPFAQNRAIGAILEHVGADEGRKSLLTAFATDYKLAGEVREIYISRGQGQFLLEGLRIGLTENLAEPSMENEQKRHWYHSLSGRLVGLGDALDAVFFDSQAAVDWDQICDHLQRFLIDLDRLDAIEPVPGETLGSLVAFWRRSMTYAPVGKRGAYLDMPVVVALREGIAAPFLAVIFCSDASLELADAFIERLSQKQDVPLDAVLDTMVNEHWAWASEVGALSFLTDRLQARADALDWLAGRTIDSVQKKQELLPSYLPVLDRLAACSIDRELQQKVSGLRQRAFRDLCEAASKGEGMPTALLVFDDASRAGLQEYLSEVDRQASDKMEILQAEAAQARSETRLAEARLARAEASLGELRKTYRQPDREIKFAERLRLLGELASVAAGIDRFSRRAATENKDLVGVARRLDSLLAAYGAEPFGEVGAEVEFDPSQHEFIGETDMPVETVIILERGYTIPDLEGKIHCLRAARVGAKGGKQ